MQFDSLTFCVFFVLVLGCSMAVRGWGARKWFLLLASYVFYSAWSPVFLPLLLASTTFDWWGARRMDAAHGGRARLAWLSAIVACNLGLLGYFKYSNFLAGIVSDVMRLGGVQYETPRFSVVLPIGISFYTFHSLSYCIDVYRRRFPATHDWRDYSLYVAFFPQLVAGPIVRWTQMREQLATPRKPGVGGVGMGLSMLVVGLFEKIVLADAVFAPVADGLFNAPRSADTAAAWIGAVAFTGQIFCDFAGYSTCALGAALMLGFRLPINFRNPYAALGFSDFWRRWHISLSSWLRDYLYVPLGGSRHGARRTVLSLALTMLTGGLWHGAAWTFVVWGGLHALLLVAERGVRAAVAYTGLQPGPLGRAAAVAATLTGIVLTWVWFRAPDLATAWSITSLMIGLTAGSGPGNAPGAAQQMALVAFAAMLCVQWLCRNHTLDEILLRIPTPLLGVMLGGLAGATVLSPGDSHAFIYFQF